MRGNVYVVMVVVLSSHQILFSQSSSRFSEGEILPVKGGGAGWEMKPFDKALLEGKVHF